jgi:pyruvate/2-oxoglutarate dehydrogenase complex dihydrolipoamide acyltransferase (E2) component/acyl carrier protein
MSKARELSEQQVELCLPQMGEGLQEARIMSLLKQAGDSITEDEVVYEMETDKATLEVESPYAGKLVAWLVEEGDIVPIGTVIAILELPQAVSFPPLTQEITSVKTSANKTAVDIRHIPPRVRSYCTQHNISNEVMLTISYTGKKLMLEDVDAFLHKQDSAQLPELYQEVQLSKQQQALNFRFKQSAESVIPATLVSVINLEKVKSAIQTLSQPTLRQQQYISELQGFAYLTVKVAAGLAKFRSVIIDNKRIHEYKHLNLGIAVQTAQNELVIAVIPEADKLNFAEFISCMQEKINLAQQGIDQAAQWPPHLILTYMGSNPIIFGSPLLVSPSVATLFLGGDLPGQSERLAYLSLTFDHRLINGMDANQFLTLLTHEINGLNRAQASQPVQVTTNLLTDFKSWLLAKLADILAVAASAIDTHESLGLQGMDSLKAVQLIKCLENYFKVEMSPTLLWHYPTYEALLDYLAQRFALEQSPTHEQGNNDENLDALAAVLNNLSLEEVDNLFKDIEEQIIDGKENEQ